MSNTVIRIKRSSNASSFANIVYGEPAFTANGNVLFVGGVKNYVDAGGAANTSTTNASFATANQTITFTRDDTTTFDVQIDATVANTSTTSAVFTSSNNTLCYQETANVSTACGGLSTGSYFFNGTGNYSGFNDGGNQSYFIDVSLLFVIIKIIIIF